jgi:hypothetical protein
LETGFARPLCGDNRVSSRIRHPLYPVRWVEPLYVRFLTIDTATRPCTTDNVNRDDRVQFQDIHGNAKRVHAPFGQQGGQLFDDQQPAGLEADPAGFGHGTAGEHGH